MSETSLRHTPLHGAHVAAGGKMVPFAGWDLPISYEGIREEHLAVRTHAGMFDVSHMGEFETEGPDASRFLQRVLSNDLSELRIGGAQYSVLCNEHGGVIDDLFTYRLAEEHFLTVTNAANHTADLRWMARWIGDFDCVLRDVADRWAMLAVQGPHAREIVTSALGVALPGRMQVMATVIDGAPGVACGTGYTGEDGVELLIDPGRAADAWRRLLDAGVVPAGLGARDTLRLDVCFHLHGNDLTAEHNPIEAGLGWCCVEESGFVGSEPIAEVRASGPRQKLAAFTIEGPGIPRPGNAILAGEETVGEVTSGTFSPSMEVGIGMGYVRADLAGPETELLIDVRGKRRAARVGSKPLYRKDG